MLRKLLFLSFIEGAAVMAAELCGAKLLSPIFGSSLYVWASVMGITLAALALGYFFGGLITQRPDPAKKLFGILMAASLFLILMPVISYYLVPRISYISFFPAVVLSTVSLLFFPVFFLGASSPLFIALQSDTENHAGKVSGVVYAVSTLGGILATFICGFWLMPLIGLNYTLLIFGSLLFVSSLFVFKIIKVAHLFLLAVFVYLNLQFTLKKNLSLMESDSILGHLEVRDVVSNERAVRLLTINNIIQTEMDLKTKKSVSGYIDLLDTLIPYSTVPSSALLVGLGGGSIANLLVQKNSRVCGVEFDERIIKAAKDFFFLDKRIKTVCEDGRYFLNHCKDKFDLIVFDVYKSEEQPGHIITSESLEKIKSNLKPGAIMYINWHGYSNKLLGKGTSILYNTLVHAGFKTKVTSLSKDENHRNIIFIACLEDYHNGKGKEDVYSIKNELVLTDLLNTDDKQVLEKYNAEANKTWRNNYLRFYQNN
ncbi:MAG: hypothetical protein JWO32_2537 [Bacteroidetes bacterium]|nr:hypothetical protein [Bacteroidota bacterium]